MRNGTETAPEGLRFPRGVRLALAGEFRRGARDAVERSANAQITTGFVAETCAAGGYSTFIKANIHADEIWAVFEALAECLLPEIAAPLGYSTRREAGWHVHIVLLSGRWKKAWLYFVLAGKNLLQALGLRKDDAPRVLR